MVYEHLVQSLLLTLLLEMGDKSQIITIILAAYYRRPILVLSGALAGHLIATSTAMGIGEAFVVFIPLSVLRFGTAIVFIVIGMITLIYRNSVSTVTPYKLGAPLSSFVMTLSSELGDKTWFAAIALATSSSAIIMVFTGVMIALAITSVVAVALGEALLKKLRIKWIKAGAGIVFVATGLLIILGLL